MSGIADIPAPGSRSPEQIRDDIVVQRKRLGGDVAELRGRVRDLTDIRKQVNEHRQELIIAGAATGALLGAAVLLRRRGRDEL